MLWKANREMVNGLSNGTICDKPSLNNQNGSHSTKITAGVVVYPFQDYRPPHSTPPSANFLNLSLGDWVIICREPVPGWYYGYKKYQPHNKGLFPSSHIQSPIHNEFTEFAEILCEVAREWGEIRKKLFVQVHSYQFEQIGRGIFELIEGRRVILNQSLTQDQFRELFRRLCSRIDWGNRKLGLDLIPWSFLADDDCSLSSNSYYVSNSIVAECNKDAGKLFRLHEKSVDSGSRGSATLSRTKGKNRSSDQPNNLYVGLREFGYSFSDDCEISFSLFDGQQFISEKYTILYSAMSQSAFHTEVDRHHPTLFTEITQQRKDLYLVIYIIRIGKMFYTESSKKLVSKKKPLRRPYACGVVPLSDLITVMEEEDFDARALSERTVKLYTSDEKDFYQVHDLIIGQNYKNIVSKIIPVLNSFSIATFFCTTSLKLNPSPTYTRLIGIGNRLTSPGSVRNDLYLTLVSLELVEKKPNKAGGAKSYNVEVEIQVVDEDDDILKSLDGNCFKSLVLHHVNCPRFNECIKFAIPIEIFPRSKVRLIFRHCSTKDKAEKKMFALTWLNLMNSSGTTLRDGDHVLHLYKWTDEGSLPVPSTNLPISRDNVILESLMVSTKFTQNPDLVNILRWKLTRHSKDELKTSLQNLIKSTTATEEIIRKFLQDVLDALFTIFSDEDGNSTDYSGDVFTLLVNIFQVLKSPSYSPYMSLLDSYCKDTFAAALVHKGLLLSLKHYTTVLLNSVAEDITQLIQNCYGCLQFIFKFIVQSQMLFAKATEGQLEDSFRRDVSSLIQSFCLVFSCKDPSPVFISTQAILLENLHWVYEELLHVMPLMDVCDLVCEVFESITVKETTGHACSPAKLFAILKIVKSSLFHDATCRAKLLPVICKHIRHHLAQREELKLVTDVLSEILIHLKCCGEESHADIEIVCTTTLEVLVQSVLVLERTTTIVGNLVACLISLLEQMNHYHYNRLWDEFHERKPLRDLLLRVFLLFRDFIKHNVFPCDWAYMNLLVNHVMLQSLQEFCQPLVTDFLKFFDEQLWTQYFSLAVTFISQAGLQLEQFRDSKVEWIMKKYGDMRLTMCYQMLQLWNHLGENEKRNFTPGMIGPFLEITMIPLEELRVITLQTLFYDMMLSEYRLSGVIKETESELIDKLDLLMNCEQNGQMFGDREYRIKFEEIHIQRLENDKVMSNDKTLRKMLIKSIKSLSLLQQLLLDYRDVLKSPIEENRDKLIKCTVNLLNFYEVEQRIEQYIRYVYKLHDMHLSCESFTEAGFTLLLHGKLLNWDLERILPESYDLRYPRQREAERKELIYLRALTYFDQGKVWEKGITLCKELAVQYEQRYDYQNLSKTLQTQAQFYNNILTQWRPEPEYFRVAFYGKDFPLFVRNKEFVCRGHDYERLAAFIQRIAAEWPNAEIMQKNAPPGDNIMDECSQRIQICNVKPKSGPKYSSNRIPEKIKSFYLVNDVRTFQYDRRFEKEPIDDDKNASNEFRSMWIERTTLKTASEFPNNLKWLEVVEKKTIELSPIEYACERMEDANSQLIALSTSYLQEGDEEGSGKTVNPLSMRLQGMLDAAVMGGISKYTEAFFNDEFLKQEESSGFVLKLISLLQEQVKLLEQGLDIHGKLINATVQPLHQRLLECHQQMKSSVHEAEQLINSKIQAIYSTNSNNSTYLSRSDSSSASSAMRDSFRKVVGSSIVNSPLPPVPKETEKPASNPTSNRSSVSSTGYGHIHIPNRRKDTFDDEDDDVYSHPVEDGVNANRAQRRPQIPSRLRDTSPRKEDKYDYIIIPPAKVKEINKSVEELTSPPVPPKPKLGANSPPPPLLPRKPVNNFPSVQKTSSMSSLSSTGDLTTRTITPPPVPPKPKANNVNGSSEEQQNTYMNKSELLAQMDSLNKNSNENISTSGRRSDHKEYFVPANKRDSANSN